MSLFLSNVIAEGTLAALPAFGIDGRIYFTTDTHQAFYDTGAAWIDVTARPIATLSATPSAGGNFQIAHGLSITPSRIQILMTSDGGIWQQAAPDATNVNLAASDAPVTATIYVFA